MICKLCGCSEQTPCPGGCFWVFKSLCSECVLRALLNQAQSAGRGAALGLYASMNVALEVLTRALEMDEVTEPADAAAENLPRLWRPGDPLPEGRA